MDFTAIGKIGAFAKQKNLIYAANYRIKTGQRLTDSNGNLNFTQAAMFNSVQSSKTNSDSATDKAKLAAIKSKLKSGKKLSASEMNYLREKDAKLYKKAKYADDAREELKAELRKATTKQEAREAVMRMTAKIAADCSADFDALKGGGGGVSLGAGMNVGGDISADMNGGAVAENMNVEGGENISSGEISFANSENVDATANENSVSQNENSFAQGTNSQASGADSDSDTALDILDKYIYAIRAIQNEWLEFTKSDEYKDLPEDIFEAAEFRLYGDKKSKVPHGQIADAILAYQKSMNYELE